MLSFVLLIAAQAPSAVRVGPGGETLSAPMPAGFKVGFTQAGGGQTIEERVPARESVDAWTRMITIQRFAGLAAIGPHRLLERLAALMIQACPGAKADPIADGGSAAGADASLRVDCPRNPATGKPETMFARGFRGEADVHLVQYAYRSVPNAAEIKAAADYLAAVRLE
jgi:hypothetical protein